MTHHRPPAVLARGILDLGAGDPRWTAATATAPGYSPFSMLGRAWDLRPWEEPPQPEIHRALGATAAPDGLTLRVRYLATPTEAQRFAPLGSLAIQLWVAAWDFYPRELKSVTTRNVWPGPKAQAGHGYAWPYERDTNAEADDVKAWAMTIAARNAIDVAPYLATPGAEFDLGELAGGARYIIAFWRGLNVLRAGVDDLNGVRLGVPWEVRHGRPAQPCHRNRWCLTDTLPTPEGAYAGGEGSLFDAASRHAGGATPPFPGTAHFRVSNGSSSNLIAGIEEWSGGPAQRVADTWTTGAAYQVKVALPLPVAGLLNWYVGQPDAEAAKAALYHLDVTR